MEVEEVDSDEWEEFDDDPITVTDCLFCPHHSANLDNNIKQDLVGLFIFVFDLMQRDQHKNVFSFFFI